MPNVWSCNTEWFDKLKDGEKKVVVTTWSERGGESLNQFLERLQTLELSGVPVHVIDCDSCKATADRLGIKEAGETVVFASGVEKGRVMPDGDIDGNMAKVREMVEGD